MTTNSEPTANLETRETVVVHTGVIEAPLEPLYAEAKKAVMTDAMGALVIFDGIVRNHDHGEAVAGLAYTAHPQVNDFMATCVEKVMKKHPGVRAWAVHRVGPIPIGESALTVMAAAAHRGQAFAACEDIADHIKAEVPIWKEQELTDGRVEWVGIETPQA